MDIIWKEQGFIYKGEYDWGDPIGSEVWSCIRNILKIERIKHPVLIVSKDCLILPVK